MQCFWFKPGVAVQKRMRGVGMGRSGTSQAKRSSGAFESLPAAKKRPADRQEVVAPVGLLDLEKFRTRSYPRAQTFWSKKRELRELSNFADIPVTVRGLDYPTGEHAFHGQKFLQLLI